jgi:hypothetical protein
MDIRYAANGMPIVKKEPQKPEPVVEQVEEIEENVEILNDDVEEGNVPADNE